MLKTLKPEPLTHFRKYRWYIGIDSGVNTGFAIWDSKEKRFLTVTALPIHDAMFLVRDRLQHHKDEIMIRVEDARKRTWFGKAGREQLQGAGSIKRDAKIWEDFLTAENANFQMVAPKNNKTKTDAEYFKRLTDWPLRCSEHARDAAMLVFGH